MAQSSPPTYTVVVEQSSVAPPAGKVAGFSLPLAFLDLNWLHASPVHRLIFYQHAVSRTQFEDTIIPHLKTSFSIALQYYPLLAAKLAVPSDYSTPPEIVFVDGDGVPLVFAVSSDDSCRFDCLSSNHVRNSNEFYPLIPTLPSVRRCMFAVQVTVFPEAGICVGIANHHVVGDGSSIFGFMKAWTALSLLGQKSSSLSLSDDEYLPFLDRSVIEDPKGLKTLVWNQMKYIPIDEDSHGVPLLDVTGKARATFIFTRNDIQKLKTHVISRRRSKVARQPSSFVVTCAYMWTCLLKSQCYASSINRDGDDDDDTVYFLCAADCRARFDTPLPANYFGNCLVPCIARAKAGELAAEEGLAAAAEVIGEAIHRQLQGEEGVLSGAENWMSFFATVSFERILSVAGSPRLDYYKMDFGWGKPKKIETTSIDYSGAIYVGCAKESSDIEVGVSVPVAKMHLLKTLFDEGLQALSL